VEHIVQIAGLIPDATVGNFFDTMKSNSFSKMESVVRDLLLDGFSAQQLLEQIFNRLISDPDISDVQKSVVLLRITDADRRLTDGCDEYMQLLSVASAMMKTFCVQ
jgi:replication factor C subunit 2/4